MVDLADWHQMNNDYLTTALEWLDIHLSNILLQQSTEVNTPEEDRLSQSLVNSVARLEYYENQTPPPALITLSRSLGLSRFEREVLILCTAIELTSSFAALYAQCNGNQAANYPTASLALRVFESGTWDIFSPERPLLNWSLIEIIPTEQYTIVTKRLQISSRILHYIKGLSYLDEQLSPLFVPFEVNTARFALSASQLEQVDFIVHHIQATTQKQPFAAIHLIGHNELSKQSITLAACVQLGIQVFRLPLGMLPDNMVGIDHLIRLWQRESILVSIAIYLDLQDVEFSSLGNDQVLTLTRFLLSRFGIVFLSTLTLHPLIKPTHFVAEVTKPTAAEQSIFWQSLIDVSSQEAVRLVSQFDLEMPTIQQVADAFVETQNNAASTNATEGWSLWAACQEVTRLPPSGLAQRIDTKAIWDDIVLPASEIKMLRQLVDQVTFRSKVYDEWGFRKKMNRGLGISALFAGDSGTGKTMAAEVIANTLHLYLYRIDLSSVVSKYIGETEKNLRQLFDAAEESAAILFFDEADALFGKRSEVKNSHDRYANIETNYLLQRLESYRGLVILATNKKANMDDAFLRRFRFIVSFPLPGVPERKQIWKKVFPANTPVQSLDYDRLSQLVLTGGNIHNIAMGAAFLAASTDMAVNMEHVLTAAENELRKLDRLLDSVTAMMTDTTKQR